MASTVDPSREKTSPFSNPLFRWLWMATLVSNIGTWMQEVANGWLMTTLAPDPMMVSLVQAATTLPMFLLALPAGALADVIDRRRYLLATQTWMMISAALAAVLTLSGQMSPWLLLICTFTLAVGSAMNSPAWHAVTPEIVKPSALPAAVALNGMAINGARAVGPALGGMIVVAMGPGAAFLINAVSFLAVVGVLFFWKRCERRENVPAERFFSAMRVGVQHVRHSTPLRSVLLRAGTFVGITSSLWALLPLLCQREYGFGPKEYGLFLTLFGAGAVLGGVGILPRLRARYSADEIVTYAWLCFVPVLAALGLASHKLVPCMAMLWGGACWICILASFHLAAQSIAPAWVRARAMSVYLLAFFGAGCCGSLFWGYLARGSGLRSCLMMSAAMLLVSAISAWFAPLQTGENFALQPSHHWEEPVTRGTVPHQHGPIMVCVEYEVSLDDAEEFRAAMDKIRRIRLRNGVLRWGLFVDLAVPTKYREVYLEESWGAHLRQHERVTAYEAEVAREAYRFHRGERSPEVFHHAYCDEQFPTRDYGRSPFPCPTTANGVPLWFLD